jgi:hypothetical protein
MSATRLAHFALLLELELLKTRSAGPGMLHFVVRKTSEFEVCPRCASKCHTTYDRRRVRVFDAPLRNKKVLLEISKRRFLCKSCCIASTFRMEHDETRSAESYPENFKTFFNRDPYNFILNLAHNDKGVTYEDVNRLCGTKGLEAFQELIDQQILKCDDRDNSLTYRFGASISNHCDFGLMQIKLSADHFDRKLIGTKAARLFHATASLTPDALVTIHSLITTCIHDILKLKDDPKNSGNIPFFADFLMNVYDRSTVEGIKEICNEPS